MTKLNKLIQTESPKVSHQTKRDDLEDFINRKTEKYIIKKPIQEEDLKSEHHKPEHHKPEHHKPEHHKPENHESEHHKPEHHESESHKPENHKPENHKPENHKPKHHEKIKVVNPKAQNHQVENSVSGKTESQAIETIKDLKKLIIKVKFKVATTSLPEDIRELDSITKTQESGSNTKTPVDSSDIGQAHGVINSFNVSESSPYKKQAEGLFAQLQVGEDIGVFNGLLTAIKSARSDHNQFVEYAKLRRLVDKQRAFSDDANLTIKVANYSTSLT